MDTIRVGIIRCDCHALLFACNMEKHDPHLLRQPLPPEQTQRTRLSWQRGLIHRLFYTKFGYPETMTVESVDGFEIVKLWDQNRFNAEVVQKILLGKPQICETLDEVTDDVDLVFLSDCNGDGSDHLELARPGLLKGVPTFVDKPLALKTSDALSMLDLSSQNQAPILSLSILRTLPAADRFAVRRGEIGELQFATIQSEGDVMAALVHPISLAQALFGPGIESVRCMGDQTPTNMRLYYPEDGNGPPRGVMINTDTGDSPGGGLYASCYGTKGVVHSPPLNEWEFPHGAVEITRQIKQMVVEEKGPVPDDEMIEVIAVVDAARQSLQEGGQPVYVQKVVDQARAESAAENRAPRVPLKPVLLAPGMKDSDTPVQFVPA